MKTDNIRTIKELVERQRLMEPSLLKAFSEKTLYNQVSEIQKKVEQRILDHQRWAKDKTEYNPEIAFLSHILVRINELKILGGAF